MAKGSGIGQVINSNYFDPGVFQGQAEQGSSDPAKSIYSYTDLFQRMVIKDKNPALAGLYMVVNILLYVFVSLVG